MKRLCGLAIGAFVTALFCFVWVDRYGRFPQPVFVDVPRGTSTWRIGLMLRDAGVVRHPLLFAAARLMRVGNGAQAGEYRFENPDSPAGVLARMARGDVHLIEVTVVEGATVFDIADALRDAGLSAANGFAMDALLDEGFLFPSTYRFRRNVTAGEVRAAMRYQFDRVWQSIGGGEVRRDVVTLASLVEKEAVLADERPRIAGVYANRLRIGMKLDCDPTVEYAARLAGQWDGIIHASDLERRHPYNTYLNAGLPPGPIANPGEASLRAAFAPAETKAIYFVVKPGSGGAHVFSEDFAAHERAVASYRRGKR